MGIPILIIGESGSGKTTSLRNFEPGEILVFSVANKSLPFRKKLDTVKTRPMDLSASHSSKMQYKRYAIDDSQYLMAFELFDRAKETGYGKFTDIAVRFRSMIDYIFPGSAGRYDRLPAAPQRDHRQR